MNLNLLLKKIKGIPSEVWIVSVLLIITTLAHGLNMFHYPYFENDEATYVSQAWSFISQGKLSPYTYYYDHSPLGWMFLGLWFFLTGGLTTFGDNPLISGRVFIFILHILSALLLYIVTKRVTRQKLAAALAVIVFSLSPLELYYGRRVLLDNIMVFWMLLSLFFATKTPQKLGSVILSAVTFAIATLTKENALFMGPAILYIIWIHSQVKIRIWSGVLWIVSAVTIILLYPLYAFLKGELFPGENHVSLISGIIMQSSRGRGMLPWQVGSDFYSNLMVWLNRDPWIIVGGAVCLLAAMILNEKYREIKAIALTAVAEIFFLARGQLVIDFYVLAVLPLLAMMIGIMVARPVIWAKNHISPRGYAMTISFLLMLVFVTSGTRAFTADETTNQQKAIDWIIQNVPKSATLAINNYAYPELHDVAGYKNADFTFKLQFDPEIQKKKYNSDFNNIDYLLLSHTDITFMSTNSLNFIKSAFERSQLIADYTDKTTSYIDTSKLISTNGDWAQVYEVDSKNAGLLVDSWRTYKRNFIKDSGQVIDQTSFVTTSEGQSYAMLRAVNLGDKVEFDRVWNWTENNLQVRDNDSLFVWKIQLDEKGLNHITDTNSASDADQDIAVALYRAYLKWGDKKYLNESKKIVNDIWKYEIVKRNDKYYLASGPDGATDRRLLVNPSYISPASYKLFTKIDNSHNWKKMNDDSYELLDDIQKLSSAGLFSNWIAIEPDGKLTSASDVIPSADAFGYDAFRVTWRMADDKTDPRAIKVLKELAAFYEKQWSENKIIFSEYSLKGEPTSENPDIPTSAGAVIALATLNNKELSNEIYNLEIAKKLNEKGSYWDKKKNYYSQNWAAFATLYLKPNKKNNDISFSVSKN